MAVKSSLLDVLLGFEYAVEPCFYNFEHVFDCCCINQFKYKKVMFFYIYVKPLFREIFWELIEGSHQA